MEAQLTMFTTKEKRPFMLALPQRQKIRLPCHISISKRTSSGKRSMLSPSSEGALQGRLSRFLIVTHGKERWEHYLICKWILVYTVFQIYLVEWLRCNCSSSNSLQGFHSTRTMQRSERHVKVTNGVQAAVEVVGDVSIKLVDGFMLVLIDVFCS